MKLMPSSAQRNLKSPSMNITKADYYVFIWKKAFMLKLMFTNSLQEEAGSAATGGRGTN